MQLLNVGSEMLPLRSPRELHSSRKGRQGKGSRCVVNATYVADRQREPAEISAFFSSEAAMWWRTAEAPWRQRPRQRGLWMGQPATRAAYRSLSSHSRTRAITNMSAALSSRQAGCPLVQQQRQTVVPLARPAQSSGERM